MSKFKTLIFTAAIVMLCAGAKCTKDVPPSEVVIDPSLKVRCPALPKVEPGDYKMGDLYLDYSKLQAQYIECAIRHDCLIEATDGKSKITCPALDKIKETPTND